MFTTIINDCQDDNARGRQESRIASLLQTSTSFIGVQSDLEAGLHLLDVLDATEGRPGIVLLNVAPRGGHAIRWENGTPFAYFWYHDTLVIGSVDGYTFAGAKRVGVLPPELHLLDTHTASTTMYQHGFISEQAMNHIPYTQFRSFDFTPRVAAFVWHGHHIPTTSFATDTVPTLPPAIWHIDSFGNAKTTLLPEDIDVTDTTETRFGDLHYIEQLRDVPDAGHALVSGSSGVHDARFVELVAQRGNFSAKAHARIGDDVFIDTNHAQSATGNQTSRVRDAQD
jgi:hypothetical protein